MKQTAVEWLAFELLALFHVQIDSLMAQEVKGIFQQAKAMEKEQVKEAYDEGYRNGENDAEGNDFVKMDISMFGNSENYYNETYGGRDQL